SDGGDINYSRGSSREPLEHTLERAAGRAAVQPPPGNTTISLIVTNQRVGTHELRQLGRQVHASMARAIQPFHAPTDGDVMFAVTTGEVANEQLPSGLL